MQSRDVEGRTDEMTTIIIIIRGPDDRWTGRDAMWGLRRLIQYLFELAPPTNNDEDYCGLDFVFWSARSGTAADVVPVPNKYTPYDAQLRRYFITHSHHWCSSSCIVGEDTTQKL